MSRPNVTTPITAAIAIAAALLSACEQRTTTVQTPTGTTTTTTIAPSTSASAALDAAGGAVANAALTAKVKSALLADASVKGMRIDVDSRDGVVTLNGTADSADNVTRAETLARGVDGVRSVENRLTVGAPATSAVVTGSASSAADRTGRALDRAGDSAGRAMDRAADSAGRAADRAGEVLGDAALTAKVKTALLADPDVKGLAIDVDSKDGVVTLNGSLEQRALTQRAESIAKGVDGVKSVNNRLTFKSPG
ncbi:BON domain-containing protein [Piscinibacter koreensis]|uniref:BON domain-containing protein n=1 Tax=Piscinibacter koreensis TaxID=2742824 RepID=A0A7Y6TY82_9BURK|nr:BON domain-containing protein [Schlegelella koreensis]NUZ07832.1 BON domain-containing protein [Schlegelella koreensis]